MLGIAAIALSFTAPVWAADTTTPPPAPATTPTPPPAPAKPKRHQWTGIIESIDAKAGSAIVKKDTESKTFKIVEKTKYSTLDKKDAAITDIKVGDKVTVVYAEESGVNTALRIGPTESAKKKEKEEQKN